VALVARALLGVGRHHRAPDQAVIHGGGPNSNRPAGDLTRSEVYQVLN
jgi:hypothetical protein